MGNYRVYVYAICKNERAFAARWMQSMREADGVYVLDTGSTDGTPEIALNGAIFTLSGPHPLPNIPPHL